VNAPPNPFVAPEPRVPARLVPKGGSSAGVVSIPLDPLPFTLGRATDRTLSLPHPHISRSHALIDRDVDGYFLRDTGSLHGTFVNGLAISSTRLRDQDVITLGTSEHAFVFEDAEQESSTTRVLIAQFSGSREKSVGHQSDLNTLTLFLKAAQSLNQHGALKDVLRTMLEYTLRLTGAERGFVFLGDTPEGLRIECAQDKDGRDMLDALERAGVGAGAGEMGAEETGAALMAAMEALGISQSIVREAVRSQLEFVLSNVTEETAVDHKSLIAHAIRSVAAIPLRGQNSNRLLGLLYLDTHGLSSDGLGRPGSGGQMLRESASGPFSRTNKEILSAIAHQAATLLENLRMLEAERESVLLRKELEIAASIQRQIIPQRLPQFPFAEMAARSVPCTGVGGDFYDVIPIAGGFVAMVGDVCGKGVPAALLASMVHGMIHAQITSGASLIETVQSVNSFFCSRAPYEKYFTLAILRYAGPERTEVLHGEGMNVELINGGHVSPLIVRADGRIETVDDGDMPVGLLGFATFHTISLNLGPGDRLVLLSDGISEAEDREGVQFGTTQLEQYLTQKDPIPALFGALEGFCHGARPQDDQTVMTIDRIA